MNAKERFAQAQQLAKVPGSVVLAAWNASRRPGVVRADMSGLGVSEFSDWVAGTNASSSGAAVNERTAMAVSAVYACVALIAGAIASLPLHIYRRRDDGDRERVKNDLWWLLNEHTELDSARGMSAATMRECLIASRSFYGDAFIEIKRASYRADRIVAFVPHHPLLVDVKREAGDLRCVITPSDGGKPYAVNSDDMLHIPGLGFDGLRSQSQLRWALRNSTGIALAADEYSARFFGNSARPDIALQTAGTLSVDAADTLRRTWLERYQGANKSHLPVVLTGGLDVKQLTMTAEDSQLIATRQFQVEDIARVFGVPPFMIGHTEKTSSWGSGVEQMSIGFVKYTLQRHLTKIEQEINRKCWPRDTGIFAEFSVEGLLRGDAKSRSEYYRAALGGSGGPGWMTQDEVRRLENQPAKGGDADELTKWALKGAVAPDKGAERKDDDGEDPAVPA